MAAIVIDPAMPLWGIVLLVLVAVCLSAVTLAGSGLSRAHCLGIWGLRTATVVLVALLLLQPEMRIEKRHEQRAVIGVAVDASASMVDRPAALENAPTRGDRARSFLDLGAVRGPLRNRFRTIAYAIGSEAHPVEDGFESLEFTAPRSHLTRSLNGILAELAARDAVGLLVLSDGLDQSTEALAAVASRIPTVTVELEPPVPEKRETKQDVWITDLTVPRRTVVGWEVEVRAVVRRRGEGALTVPVKLYREGYVLNAGAVRFDAGQHFQTVRFTLQPPEEGRILYKLELAVPEGDPTPDNNAEDFVIEVTDPETRVLYLEGTPRWEFKFLKRALLADRNISLEAYVETGGSFLSFSQDARRVGAHLPEFTADALAAYKAVILGDVGANALNGVAWRELADFVDRGGGLLVLGGRHAYGAEGIQGVAPVRKLLPVRPSGSGRMHEGRFPALFTDQGRAHAATRDLAKSGALPPLLSVWRPTEPTGAASVLVETGDGSPVLAVRRYGQGRVAMLLSNSMWRWRLGSSAIIEGRNVYDAFMSRVAFWLLPSRDEASAPDTLQVLTRQTEADVGESVAVGLATGTASADDQAADFEVRAYAPDERELGIPLSPAQLGEEVGLSEAIPGLIGHFEPHTPGEYRIEATSADGQRRSELRLLAKSPSREQTGAPIDREYLRALAEAGGGAFVPLDRWRTALDKFSAEGTQITTARHVPLWTSPWWLALLILLFTVEWWWRRSLDMV